MTKEIIKAKFRIILGFFDQKNDFFSKISQNHTKIGKNT